MKAIEQVTANPALHTRDLGGTATTAEVTRAICDLLAAGAVPQTCIQASAPSTRPMPVSP